MIVNATATFTDAPVVTPDIHGRVAQNARIESYLIAAGPTAGHDALVLLTSEIREESIGGETPLLALLDLADGAFHEIYASTRIKIREKGGGDLLDVGGGERAVFTAPSWPWGPPTCAAAGPGEALFLGTRDIPNRIRPRLLRYLPREEVVEDVAELRGVPVGMVYGNDSLWFLTSDGILHFHDDIAGVEPVGRAVPAGVENITELRRDRAGWFYTLSGIRPRQVHAFSVDGKRITQRRLLDDVHLELAGFHASDDAPLIETVVKDGGRFRTAFHRLQGGQAQTVDTPEWPVTITRAGYELTADFAQRPLRVSVRRPGADAVPYPIEFRGTGWDSIKTLMADPNGKYLYGANWPVAWIWRYDPEKGTFHIYDRHYVFYEMQPWRDEIWVIGYWGIKLLRWRPDEPWTFDYSAHYFRKTYPANTSPWGDKDVSNPRLVCKFRYLKDLQCRRPSGLAFGADGRAYVGGRTPAVEYFGSRHGGAVSWYDPETETIGQIREPFLHHSVRDVCSAADRRYVAAVGSAYICMYEPLPEDFNSGKFVLYDTQEKRVVVDSSPLGTALSYCEEGEPGRIVVAGAGPGRYAGDDVGTALFIFDTTAMAVTHVVRVPFKIGWAEYNVLPFVRGPDRRIYFYGHSAAGTALFRIDSVSGQVEAVLRAPGVTDVATYNNPGAPFAFAGDRVYFGVRNLVSVPSEAVLGVKAGSGK